jgi:phosphate transport system substrate-binding protein
MRKPGVLVAGLAAVALMSAACGGTNDDGGGGGGNDALTGSIFISGSSTVEPISSLVAELFAEENPDVEITVEGPGTGDGFELFCNGETDISDASRAIEQEEIDACAANGVEYTELEVAIDGMAVLTSPANDAVTCLSFPDLYALLGPESEGFESWSDANDLGAEVGGSGDYPDAPLVVTAPGEESGTYDSFIEIALEGIAEERGQDATTRPDYQASANDNVIIDGIAGTDTSLGWVGFSFYEQNQEVVKAIEVDGGEGCVAPTFETIAEGSYPLSRSLYIYVNNAKAAESEALTAFVDFYMTDTGLLTSVQEVAYVTLPEDRIEATRGVWEGARPA